MTVRTHVVYGWEGLSIRVPACGLSEEMSTVPRGHRDPQALGVARDAEGPELKKVYRRLALKLHPDKNPSPDAGARFRAVTEAYATLSSPADRRTYDGANRRT